MTGTAKPGLSIILPALNEACNLEGSVADIVAFMNAQDVPYEIIVVNDGSTDGTADVLARLSGVASNHLRCFHFEQNRGYGAALRQGIRSSKHALIFFTDADRQFDIRNLRYVLPLMWTGVPDIVIGYRARRRDPIGRRLLSWGYNTLASLLLDLDVKDIDCAFKVFSREIFDTITLYSARFCINTEVLAKARVAGYRILEVGVDHFPRKAGQSSVNLWYVPMALCELLLIWRDVQQLR